VSSGMCSEGQGMG